MLVTGRADFGALLRVSKQPMMMTNAHGQQAESEEDKRNIKEMKKGDKESELQLRVGEEKRRGQLLGVKKLQGQLKSWCKKRRVAGETREEGRGRSRGRLPASGLVHSRGDGECVD